MKRIEFEGQIHEFPDDATEAEIIQALGGTKRPPFLSGLVEAYRNPRALVAEMLGGSARAPLPGGYRSPEAEALGDIAARPVPESFTESGMLVGTVLGGAAGGRVAGVLGRAAPALGRIVGGAAGGGAGGALEGEPGRGALIGGGGAAAGELAGVAGGKLLRSLPWMKGVIARQDMRRAGSVLEGISPPLGPLRTAEQLRSSAAGPGRQALRQAHEASIQQIEHLVGATPLQIPSLGPTPLTIREANDKLTAIGEGAFNQHILDRTTKKLADRRLYGLVRREIVTALDAAATGAGRVFDQAQQTYAAGLEILRQAGKPAAFRAGEAGLQFNTPAWQRAIANPRTEATLRQRFGDLGFERLREALLRGGAPGEVDVLVPGSGGIGQAAGEILRGKGGAPQIPALLLRTPLPNLGSTYAGRPPYTLPPALQTILDVALQRAGAAGLPR